MFLSGYIKYIVNGFIAGEEEFEGDNESNGKEADRFMCDFVAVPSVSIDKFALLLENLVIPLSRVEDSSDAERSNLFGYTSFFLSHHYRLA